MYIQKIACVFCKTAQMVKCIYDMRGINKFNEYKCGISKQFNHDLCGVIKFILIYSLVLPNHKTSVVSAHNKKCIASFSICLFHTFVALEKTNI